MDKENWATWIEKLYEWKLHRITAALLEGLGPLHMVGAQLLYLTQPILSVFIPSQSAADLADLLEDPGSTHRFIKALRAHDT